MHTVLSHGSYLDGLREAAPADVVVEDVATAARTSRSAAGTPCGDGTGPAILQGTAGSTGAPKTAALAPAAVLSNLRGLDQRCALDSSIDACCSWLPLYHDMGLTFVFASALGRLPLWLAPTTAFAASPFNWLTWLSDSHATITAAPNFAYNLLGKYARRVSDVDLGGLRVAINGGEPVDCEGFARFADAMAPFGFDAGAAAPSYGLAESTCAVTMPVPGTGLRLASFSDDTGSHKHAALGDPIPGMQVRIASSDRYDNTTGPEVGEIEIRGTPMMNGYLGHPAIDRDDWFPTGDLGFVGDAGLVVCGRAKEIISIAGRNIFPTEIELVAALGVAGQSHTVLRGMPIWRAIAQSFKPLAIRRCTASNSFADRTRASLLATVMNKIGGTADKFCRRAGRYDRHPAGVMKLANMPALGAGARESLRVRVPPPAPSTSS